MEKTDHSITSPMLGNTADTAPIAVDIKGLSELLSCGQPTARKIGEEAKATIRINRRVLYNVEKIREYLYNISI